MQKAQSNRLLWPEKSLSTKAMAGFPLPCAVKSQGSTFPSRISPEERQEIHFSCSSEGMKQSTGGWIYPFVTWRGGDRQFLGKDMCILTWSALSFLHQTLPQEESPGEVSMDQSPEDKSADISSIPLETDPTASLEHSPPPPLFFP